MITKTNTFKTMIPASTELRDEIAISVLPALLVGHSSNIWEVSRKAYEIADAMLEVREERDTVTS